MESVGDQGVLLQALDAGGSFVMRLDGEGRVLSISRACREVSGYSLREAQGRFAWELYSRPDESEAVRAAVEALRAGEGARKRLSHCPGQGASSRLIAWTDTPIRAQDGTLAQVVSIGDDVTEQVREAVTESEQRYRAIFENTGTAMTIVEADTTISLANSQFAELSGFSREEIEGRRRWTEFIAPDDLERMVDYHRRRRVDPQSVPRNYEARFVRRSGELRHVFMTVAMIPGTERSVASLLDISERRRAEDALRRSEDDYRGLVEDMLDWVWEVDENARYTYASPRVRDLLGCEPEEVIGKTPFDLMPPGEAERIRAEFERVAACREPFALLRNTLSHRDGRRVVVETSGTPIFDEAGLFRGYRGIDRDVTERTRVQDALDSAQERLLDVEREKKLFYREIIRAVTDGKLMLVDAPEIPTAGRLVLQDDVAERAAYARLRNEIRAAAADAGMEAESAADLVLASAEAAANAIKHAGGGRAEVYVTEDRLAVRISDRGPGIQPGALPATILIPGYSTGVSLGMGYTLMLRLSDTIWLATEPGGTVVQLEKWLHPKEHAAAPLLAAWENL